MLFLCQWTLTKEKEKTVRYDVVCCNSIRFHFVILAMMQARMAFSCFSFGLAFLMAWNCQHTGIKLSWRSSSLVGLGWPFSLKVVAHISEKVF